MRLEWARYAVRDGCGIFNFYCCQGSTRSESNRKFGLRRLAAKVRIAPKICAPSHWAATAGKPVYLRQLLLPFEANTVVRHAPDDCRLNRPWRNADVGFRAFPACARRLYGRLPVQVRASSSSSSSTTELFKKRLKIFLFRYSYYMSDVTLKVTFDQVRRG